MGASATIAPPLEADADQIRAFAEALFTYASKDQRISLRAFYEDKNDSFAIRPMWLGIGFDDIVRMAVITATQAAQDARPVVFCPPIAGFKPGPGRKDWHAAEQDLNEAFALSVECDANPSMARQKLEQLLGPATVVVASGGEWVEPEFGQVEDKLHLHWRLSEPASGDDLALTKEARRLAAALVGADHSNIPMVHPIRWPGTWHKKKAPRMARMVSLDAAREIDLHEALALLRDVVGDLPAAPTRQPRLLEALSGDGDAEEAALVRGIVLGDPGLHDGINRLAAKWVARGMAGGGAVNSLRALMLSVPEADRDDRWQTRFDDIPRSVSTAQEKFERPQLRVVSEEEMAAQDDGDEPSASRSEREVPSHLLVVPGLVGHITRFITKTSRFPQPLLALGASLTLIGMAAGRKYAGPTKSGTHLYLLTLAPTGAGKAHPAKIVRRILRAANMQEHAGPGRFQSETAVYQVMAAQPQMLCLMDEFGNYLDKLNAKNGSGHEKAISGALRQFWGASFDTVDPPAWAASSATKLSPINSPALSIFGMSVHDEFYKALTSADIANGFLNRFLVFSTHAKPDEVEPELDDEEIPAPLVEGLQRVAYTSPGRFAKGEDWKAEVRLDWETSSARFHYEAFRKRIAVHAESSKLLSRTAEMAVRLATICAIGRHATRPAGVSPPSVSLEDITWGCELAMWSGQSMVEDAEAYMVETEHQGQANEVLRHIRAAPKGRITRTALYGKLKQKYPANKLTLILDGLTDAELIEVAKVRTDGACKPTITIRAVPQKVGK